MELDNVRHHTNIKAVLQWFALICMLAIIAAFTALIVAQAAKLISYQLVGVDWNSMLKLGVFMIMVGIAVAIPIAHLPRPRVG